jgi:short-subunit dehydrogenase
MHFLKNKTIVISGIARGIGKALALEAAKWGMKVAGMDVRKEDLDALALELQDKNVPFYLEQVDIQDAAACQKFIEKVIENLGSLDVLINNAGITHIAPEAETSIEQTFRVMNINFMGTVHITHFALPYIQQTKGTLVGISSVAGFSPLMYRTAYAASKHAVWGYFSSLRSEMKEKNVQVLVVCPSFVASLLQEHQQAYFKNNTDEILTPAYVASEIFKALDGKKETLFIGKTAQKAYWVQRFFPNFTSALCVKK